MPGFNLLAIMSDEHNPKVAGYAGHARVVTPNLDALAARGTVFRSAYTTSPLCMPARAGFACGKYIHQIGYWDNVDAYDGAVPSWHHALRERGHRVVSIGKLHFRRANEDHGFCDEQIPMHRYRDGDVMGLVREDLPRRGAARKLALLAGPGETPYTHYDREICSRAQIWLREHGVREPSRPWVLFVSFVAPHFPLTAPPEHFYRYHSDRLQLPKLYRASERPRHPYLDDYRGSFSYDEHFETESDVRRAIAGYYGLVSYLDELVGKLLAVLRDTGLARSTRVLYTSDHGDNLGARGLWGKSTMYEESIGVPMVLAGPDVPQGLCIDNPVSHVDCFPTILETAGVRIEDVEDGHPGESLLHVCGGGHVLRDVLSEYHGMGSTTGAFALRTQRYKYVHYVKYPPQLFDLLTDPEEIRDLATQPQAAGVLETCRRKLYALCDPEEVDRRAKRRQAELLASYGGRTAAVRQGDLGFTPAPGAIAEYQ